jgi:hypothetical protein
MVFSESIIAPYNVFEEASRWPLKLIHDHIIEDGADSVESLSSLAQVVEALLVQQDFLDDEGGHCLRELRPSLHDPQTQWDYLCLKEEANHVVVIHFD